MSAETDLYAVLSGHAPLVALVADRIYPNMIAQDVSLPAGAYSRLGTQSFDTMAGQSVARLVSFTLQFWADEHADAEACAEAARQALNNNAYQRITPSNRAAVFDPEIGFYGAELTFDWIETENSV